MMIFTSIYGVVDGFFVSNYVGKTAFAAVNLIMPALMLFSALGFMLGTGGSAVTAQALGEGKPLLAKKCFSMFVYFLVILAVVLTAAGELILPWAAHLLGASDEMMPYCLLYGRILMLSVLPFMLQNYFQSLFVTAGKPQIGLFSTVLAGVTNMVGDFVTMGVLHLGVAGAAGSTMAGCIVGALIPIVYFSRRNNSTLRLIPAAIDLRIIAKASINGSSELMSNLSMSLVNMLYNRQLMYYAGEDGVSAYGVIMYVNFIFAAFFIGYSIGTAPIVSYHYGAGNRPELHGIFRKSLMILSAFALLLTAAAEFLAPALSGIFVGYDQNLYRLTLHAFRIYSLSFLLLGFNIYASSFFTALGNGFISALISFLRTLLFQVVCVLALPALFGINGIWWAVFLAEALTLVVSSACFVKERERYGY